MGYANKKMNQPDAGGRAEARPSRSGVGGDGKRKATRCSVAVVAVAAVLGGAAWWWFSRQPTPPASAAEKPKEAERQSMPTKAADTPSKPVTKEVEIPTYRTNRWGKVVKRQKPETYVDERGILRYKKGNGRVPNPEDFKNPTRISTRGNMHEFRHPVENEIAALIMTQPGDFLIGEPDYDSLKQNFVNALLEPIEIGEDDSEMDKELKKSVEEIKKDLAERVKNGEDIAEIFREARRELRQSAEYRQHLDELVQEQLYNPDISDEDLAATFKAANKMLEAKGIAPISEKRIMRARSRMLRAQERRNAATANSPVEN